MVNLRIIAVGKLKERWYFCSDDEDNWGYGGQGFHNLRVADVDFDGRDEVLYGHMCVDHDGKGLWTTGYGHGDALHLVQASPDTRGLRLWTCHEASPYGVSLIDAQCRRVDLSLTILAYSRMLAAVGVTSRIWAR